MINLTVCGNIGKIEVKENNGSKYLHNGNGSKSL